MKNRWKKVLAVCLCFTFLLAGCAENKYAGRAIGGTAGAIGGALIGDKIGGTNGALIGALIGSAVGFGIGWLADDYQAKQIKSVQQARQEEINKHGALPKNPRLNSYDVAVKPARTIKRGQPTTIVSTIDLCPSLSQTNIDVREESIITLPDKKEKKSVTQYNEIKDGGVYEFKRSIDTKGIPGGAYAYRTNLYINNKKVASRNASFKIASNYNIMLVAVK